MSLNWMHCSDWLHTLPNRIYASKEETCCLEKIHNFLWFPLLSKTPLLRGTSHGHITIHYITFSILTARKNEKPWESMRTTQWFSEKQEFLQCMPHMGFLSRRRSAVCNPNLPQISKNLFNKSIFYSSLTETSVVWRGGIGNKAVKIGVNCTDLKVLGQAVINSVGSYGTTERF